MKKELIITKDGSHTVYIPEMEVTYHSRFGALNESLHVFIENGLKRAAEVFGSNLSILETGFGTGLNALLTLQAIEQVDRTVNYHSLEKYPLDKDLIDHLNYPEVTQVPKVKFDQLHNAEWNKTVQIQNHFFLTKHQIDIKDFRSAEKFHCIYFDAFAPTAQAELWQESVFKNLFDLLHEGGILVTFCAQGEFKRNLKRAGFLVERLAGPPGKREMTRGVKPFLNRYSNEQ